MYEQEFDTAPYDNVEFPVRKPGTGTWPGPASAASTGISGAGSGSNVKLFGHQTTGRGVGGASKLAPLVEVDGSEGAENNHRMQLINFGSSQAATSSSTSTTSFTAQQHGAQSKTTSTTASSVGTELNATPTTNTFSTAAASSTSTAASTTTATTTTSSSSTSSSSASARQSTTANTTANTSKPAITVPNDSTTYVATQVTSTSETLRKKTPKQMEMEDEDFKRHDLNPWARSALERVYTQHKDFYQLNSKVLDEGSLLKQDVMDIYRKTGETLTYEQLLQGMLVDGERFLLGSCWLYFTHVQFLDVEGTRALREPYGKGRIGLTSKRALFLSTENYTDANLEQFVDASKKQDNLGYKLEVSKRSVVLFKNIPLSNFHSAEMEVVTGTAAQTKITKNVCCGCFGIGKWVSTPPMTRSINNRVLRVGVSMPPWQTRMFLDIHLDPSMSLTVARDFISQLHAFAPHMH